MQSKPRVARQSRGDAPKLDSVVQGRRKGWEGKVALERRIADALDLTRPFQQGSPCCAPAPPSVTSRMVV